MRVDSRVKHLASTCLFALDVDDHDAENYPGIGMKDVALSLFPTAHRSQALPPPENNDAHSTVQEGINAGAS
jgi:hypothetical protein